MHDVSGVLRAERDRLPRALHARLDELARISKELRRDRKPARYGTED